MVAVAVAVSTRLEVTVAVAVEMTSAMGGQRLGLPKSACSTYQR